ncbi:hypothetical protein ACF1A9_25565 [Streptomyces sp. NPDC014872]
MPTTGGTRSAAERGAYLTDPRAGALAAGLPTVTVTGPELLWAGSRARMR